MHVQPSRAAGQDANGLDLPPPEASLAEARRRLAATFRSGEVVWSLGERYHASSACWNIEILRQGATGHWMHQRYHFDGQEQVLYFLGERALSDTEFRQARQNATIFPAPDSAL